VKYAEFGLVETAVALRQKAISRNYEAKETVRQPPLTHEKQQQAFRQTLTIN
jgi:hypothetical protein